MQNCVAKIINLDHLDDSESASGFASSTCECFFYRVLKLFLCFRAEPLLTQIKGDRKLIVSPVFDRINYYDLEIVDYSPESHAFDWALWCMYESFRPEWYLQNDASLPGK